MMMIVTVPCILCAKFHENRYILETRFPEPCPLSIYLIHTTIARETWYASRTRVQDVHVVKIPYLIPQMYLIVVGNRRNITRIAMFARPDEVKVFYQKNKMHNYIFGSLHLVRMYKDNTAYRLVIDAVMSSSLSSVLLYKTCETYTSTRYTLSSFSGFLIGICKV